MPDTRDARSLLADWLVARQQNLEWLRGLTPEQQARGGKHRRWGRISVREHVVEWAYHDMDHLRQIVSALQGELYPDIGGFKGLYTPPS